MQELMARDLLLRSVAQDIVTITGLDESLCRQTLYAVTDRFLTPAAFTEATEVLLAGLREQGSRSAIVAAFWDELNRLSHERGEGEPTQPLDNTN